MQEIANKINELASAFQKDAAQQLEAGNKAAGTRARKTSLELEKALIVGVVIYR